MKNSSVRIRETRGKKLQLNSNNDHCMINSQTYLDQGDAGETTLLIALRMRFRCFYRHPMRVPLLLLLLLLPLPPLYCCCCWRYLALLPMPPPTPLPGCGSRRFSGNEVRARGAGRAEPRESARC